MNISICTAVAIRVQGIIQDNTVQCQTAAEIYEIERKVKRLRREIAYKM